MKRITLTFMILLSVFFTIWGVKMKHPINRPENVKEDTETPWYETKYQAPKADDEWTLDPEIPLNYIPVPGEDELYMVVDDSGNITNYRKRVKQADGSWVWQDVNPDIPDNYEKVDGLDNVYKVTNKDGTTEYKQYVRNDDDTYCFVPVDEKGNPLDLKNDASTISKNYVHADGNIYALYNKDNVKMGYRERVKNNDGSYLFFKEVGKHTVYKVVHPEHIEIYSIVRPRNKEKGKEEDFFEIIKLIPDYMDMRFFMPNNMDQFYFKSEMKTKGIVSCEKFRKAQITDKQINEIEDVGFFMQLIDPKKHSAFILIPSKNFFTPFCRKLGIGKVNYGIDPIRDIYLASRLKDANPFVIVYRTNDPATYGKAFTCFSEKTVKIEQSCIFDYKDALAKIEPNIIRSWQYTHTRTDIDFSYPARSINLKQKCKITLGTRLSFSDIGECAFRLQNCIFTNGGTILLPQEASRKKSNKLSPEGIVKDYNSQCYMKFDKIMEQLKSYETIPVTDMQQSVWNILEKLKFSSAFGFSNTRDLQKNYLSTFEKEGDALDVVIKILKIPGVLQRNYPGTTHDRVNECIGKIFNLKMEKLIV